MEFKSYIIAIANFLQFSYLNASVNQNTRCLLNDKVCTKAIKVGTRGKFVVRLPPLYVDTTG